MSWDRLRLYAAVLIAVLVLVVVGALFVLSRTPVSPVQGGFTWTGGAPLSAYQSGTSQSPQQIAQEVVQGSAPSSLTLPPLSTASSTQTASNPSDSSGYANILAQLSGNSAFSSSNASTSASAQSAINQAYQFTVNGFVATTAPATKPMTPDQRALYDYGNSVGAEIQSFEELHTDQAQILKDQAEDRTDPGKAAALISLGQAIAGVGVSLEQIQNVPAAASADHAALAQSYKDIGTKLQLVAKAQNDSDFVQAIETYDTSANTFVKNYAALATLFSENGVTFSHQDPGSVFTFTETSGVGAGL